MYYDIIALCGAQCIWAVLNNNLCIILNANTIQVVSIMLEQNGFGSLAEKMIFVAGHKVTTDPAAIPFSMVST